MTEIFKSKKSPGFGIFLLFAVITIVLFGTIIPIINGEFNKIGLIITTAVVLPVSILLGSIWFRTYYIIKDETFYAVSGPFKWKVSVKNIKSVKLNQKTIGGTFKPTLSWNCMIISYNTYSSLHITPENEGEFLNIIKNINPNVLIK